MSQPAVLVDGLRVGFRNTIALDGVDLETPAGTTLGVLGHNGAGKTTLVRVLTTVVRPAAGRALVDGFDVVSHGERVRQRIGVTGQYAGLDDFLTGRENLELIGRLAGLRNGARARAGELIDRLALDELAERRVGEMSGGGRRRVDLAASLVGSPSVLFLDEPTTGLDPTARLALWDVVDELTTSGTTVVLTTQYLDEADRLADNIVVLDHGRIAAKGAPAELKRLVGGKVVIATIPAIHADHLPHIPDSRRPVRDGHVSITYSADNAATAADIVADLARNGVEVSDIEVSSPSLEDVFTALTPIGARA